MLLIPKLKKIFRFLLLGCLVLGLVTMVAAPGQAQFTMPQGFAPPGQVQLTPPRTIEESNKPPRDLVRFGHYELTAIKSPIDNRDLFYVASAAVYNRATNETLTAPAQHWSVGRELRFRVRQALEANNIDIGIPRRIFSVDPGDSSPLAPSPDV